MSLGQVWTDAENLAHTGNAFLYSLVLCISSILVSFVLIVLHLAYSSLLTHDINIHASGGIQTRNPSKRSAAP